MLFLDIEMQGINGMDTAHRLRSQSENLQIVFVTGYDRYVFEGYTVGALDYLLKPATAEHIHQLLTRVFATLQKTSDLVYVCRNAEGLYRIPRKDILYFFSEKRPITCVTAQRSYTFYAKLDDVQNGLDYQFVRIHQRYLIHAPAVTRIGDHDVQISSQTLPISRNYKKQALLTLTRVLLSQFSSPEDHIPC